MSYIMPALILALLVWALIKKVNIYESFVEGAKEAFPTIKRILPYMASMLIAMTVFRASGAMTYLTIALSPLTSLMGMPTELVPLFALRPFSGNAAYALLRDVLFTHGADSFLGVAASLILGSTETIFYTVALYYGSIKVTKTRVSIPVALISGVVGTVAALIFARMMFKVN